MFSSRNKKNIDTFWLKKASYQELWPFIVFVGWCHVVCALFIPEAWFANVQTMEPIMLKNVPPDRFNKVCIENLQGTVYHS